MKVKSPKRNGFRLLALVLALLLIYSALPLIPFYFSEGADKAENNEAAIKKLSGNQGSYFSFIVFGDNHSGLFLNDAVTLKEIWQMNREDRFRKVPIDLVLSVGDITLDGARGHFESYKKMQKLIKYPLIAAKGNHDDRTLFEEYVGKGEFSFVNRNSYFIVIDNNHQGISETQFTWLEDELKKGQEYDHIFVVMHKPPFDPYQQDWYNIDNNPWAYRVRKLFAKYDVDMVFSGHKHMFKKENFEGVDYLVTGGGGMLIEIPEDDGGYLHYVRVMVNNDFVTYEVRKVSPPLGEWVTYYFWKEMVYRARNFYGSGYIFGRNTKIEPLKVSDLNDKEYWMVGKAEGADSR